VVSGVRRPYTAWVQNANYGQTDDIPVHRRLVALRDQGCQHPGGCFL
jgi:hypothetical protein